MSASREAANSFGHVLGDAFVVLAPVAIGVWWAKRLNDKREGYARINWPIVIGALLSSLVLVGMFSAPASVDLRKSFPANQDENHVVEVINGAPEADFPQSVDASTLEELRLRMTQMLNVRFGNKVGSIRSDMALTKMGGKTVLIFRGFANNGWRTVVYVGILNGARKVVTCVSVDGADFPACDEKAVDVFGAPTRPGAAN